MNRIDMTIQEALHKGETELQNSSTTPALDAQFLLEYILQQSSAFIITHTDDVLTDSQREQFLYAIQKRRQGMPLAYITRQQEFYGHEFYVDERVLIPRPETELLIDEIKKLLAGTGAYTKNTQPRIIDIGTGSGCIAITLKKEFPAASIIASDISDEALAVTKQNAHELNAQLEFRSGDLFEALDPAEKNSFNLIVSNPPYVDLTHVDLYAPESSSLRYEPRMALEPTDSMNSCSIIEQIIQESPEWLAPQGSLFIEIGYDQGPRVQEFAETVFPDHEISIIKDLNAFDRILTVIPQKNT